MQSTRTITREYVFFELHLFEVSNQQFCDKIMSTLTLNFKAVQDIFMKLHTNINQN